MNDISIDNPNVITYSNHLEFAGRKLAFKHKKLFDITGKTPIYIKQSNNGWYVNRRLLTIQKVKNLIINKSITLDISHVQWYIQEQIKHCFNL